MIIDHRYAHLEVLKSIPGQWIDSAKANLHIRYEHTSHGSQITGGMAALDAFMGGNGIYVYSNNGGDEILDLHDIYESDLSAGEFTWQQKTRDYLDHPDNQDCNVVMWSWCQILGHDGDKDPGYCSKMEELIQEYGPGGSEILNGNRTVPVQFIFMTGHVNGQGEEGETNQINNYIRNHCRTNNRILFDFADIESYDPDQNYFLDKYCHDNCVYDDQGSDDGNWATEWIAGKVEMTSTGDVAHNEPNGGDWYQCSAAHTHPVNANMKAYAAWYMFARMAGWSPSGSSVLVDSIHIYPEGGLATIDSDEGTLQLYADVFPDTATVKTIEWSAVNVDGSAVIDGNGLLTAVENGMVYAIATAGDASGASDSLEVTITHQVRQVESLVLSTLDNQSVVTSGDSLLILAEILPADADSQRVELVVEPITGTAAVTGDNYVVGGTPGDVRVIGSSVDGYGVSDTLRLTVIADSIPIEHIEIGTVSGDSVIHATGDSLQLIASVYPQNYTYGEVLWRIENLNGQAELINGSTVLGVSDGDFAVIAYSSADPDIYARRIFYVEDNTLTVGDRNSKLILAYPNPTDNFLRLTGNLQYPSRILIFNFSGELKDALTIYNPDQKIFTSQLSPGHYLLQINSGSDLVILPFTKK